jgi:cyanophycinase
MLAMVGSGEYLPEMESVDRTLLARLGTNPQVVCLPTAAGTESAERIAYWTKLGEAHFQRLGVSVTSLPVIDRASADNPQLAARIRDANFVYLSGGRPDYLFTTLQGSLAWAAINEVVARGGTLAGCSAGAMIQGEKFFGFPGWRRGFGLIPGVTILPHYDEIPEAFVNPVRMLVARKMTVIGIESLTALVRGPDGQYDVLGPGGVIIWRRSGKTRYTAGPLPPDVL